MASWPGRNDEFSRVHCAHLKEKDDSVVLVSKIYPMDF